VLKLAVRNLELQLCEHPTEATFEIALVGYCFHPVRKCNMNNQPAFALWRGSLLLLRERRMERVKGIEPSS
jgi:hypothetical protein